MRLGALSLVFVALAACAAQPSPTPATPATSAAAPAASAPARPFTALPHDNAHLRAAFAPRAGDAHDLACLDEGAVATPPACEVAAESPCAAQAKAQCALFQQVLEPKVAEAAVQCLSSRPAQAQCAQGSVIGCGKISLVRACPTASPPTEAECARAAGVPACAVDAQQCLALVSGFSPAGLDALSACVTEGGGLCAKNTFDACAERVLASATPPPQPPPAPLPRP